MPTACIAHVSVILVNGSSSVVLVLHWKVPHSSFTGFTYLLAFVVAIFCCCWLLLAMMWDIHRHWERKMGEKLKGTPYLFCWLFLAALLFYFFWLLLALVPRFCYNFFIFFFCWRRWLFAGFLLAFDGFCWLFLLVCFCCFVLAVFYWLCCWLL